MPKTFVHLKKAVAAFMNREQSAFVFNGFDVLSQACNDAHQWAQRMHIFERATCQITIPSVSISNGAELSTAVLKGTTTSVMVRALRAAWLRNAGGSGDLPIAIVSREEWVSRRQRRNDFVIDIRDTQNTNQEGGSLPLEVVLFGETIHMSSSDPSIYNSATSLDVHFDAIRWFEDYEVDDDRDFFLDYAFDFMIMRSVYNLNFYLKEDQRVNISNGTMREVWESVVSWDTSLRTSSVPITLD